MQYSFFLLTSTYIDEILQKKVPVIVMRIFNRLLSMDENIPKHALLLMINRMSGVPASNELTMDFP